MLKLTTRQRAKELEAKEAEQSAAAEELKQAGEHELSKEAMQRLSTEACRARRADCSRHFMWERLRRALLDLQRIRLWQTLDEIGDAERAIANGMLCRNSLLAVLLHTRIDHQPGAPLVTRPAEPQATPTPTTPEHSEHTDLAGEQQADPVESAQSAAPVEVDRIEDKENPTPEELTAVSHAVTEEASAPTQLSEPGGIADSASAINEVADQLESDTALFADGTDGTPQESAVDPCSCDCDPEMRDPASEQLPLERCRAAT